MYCTCVQGTWVVCVGICTYRLLCVLYTKRQMRERNNANHIGQGTFLYTRRSALASNGLLFWHVSLEKLTIYRCYVYIYRAMMMLLLLFPILNFQRGTFLMYVWTAEWRARNKIRLFSLLLYYAVLWEPMINKTNETHSVGKYTAL